MSCPTCNHTMAALEHTPTSMSWLCGRCGTVKRNYRVDHPADVYVPKLVERCRILEQSHVREQQSVPLPQAWRVIGIAEAINLPENRP